MNGLINVFSQWIAIGQKMPFLLLFFYSVNSNLPPTAYFKMIDMWFLLSLLKPFVDIITQTYIETLREDTEEKMEIENIAWEDKDISTYKGLSIS